MTFSPDSNTQSSFAIALLAWHKKAGRHDLPWQENPSPYRAWISEIMLQQTQVGTVRAYYQRWMSRFTGIESVAEAPLDEVLHLWSGLGYYARARNIHRAAQQLRDEHDGRFPDSIEAVMALPGIGRSTAGAILSLSRNERHPILDGNVKRVLCRYHVIKGWPGQAKVARELWALADQHTPDHDNAAYTQAIMDLGATVCVRTQPACEECPVANGCEAHQSGRQGDYPTAKPRKKRPVRTTVMALLEDAEGRVLLEQRPAAGVWGGLWSLPQHDSEAALREWLSANGNNPADIETWPVLQHGFTHFQLDITPIRVKLVRAASGAGEGDRQRWVDPAELPELGIAAPVGKLLSQLEEATMA